MEGSQGGGGGGSEKEKANSSSSTPVSAVATFWKDFKKASNEEKLVLFNSLLKGFQEEEKDARLSELESENRKMKVELEEFRTESTHLKNQQATIRRLEDRTRQLEQQMEEKVKEIVEIKQRNLAEENQKTMEVLKERLKKVFPLSQKLHEFAQSQLFELRAQSDEERAAKQSEVNLLMDEVEQAQTRLLSLEREKLILCGLTFETFDNIPCVLSRKTLFRLLSAMYKQRVFCSHSYIQLMKRVDIRKELMHVGFEAAASFWLLASWEISLLIRPPAQGGANPGSGYIHGLNFCCFCSDNLDATTMLEHSLSSKEKIISELNMELHNIETTLSNEREYHLNELKNLKLTLNEKEVELEELKKELQARPTEKLVDDLRKKVKILQAVGYNSIEAEDWEAATSGEEMSKLESLLLDKNRKMEHELTQFKVKIAEKSSLLEQAEVKIRELTSQINEQQRLIQKLEDDILKGYTSNDKKGSFFDEWDLSESGGTNQVEFETLSGNPIEILELESIDATSEKNKPSQLLFTAILFKWAFIVGERSSFHMLQMWLGKALLIQACGSTVYYGHMVGQWLTGLKMQFLVISIINWLMYNVPAAFLISTVVAKCFLGQNSEQRRAPSDLDQSSMLKVICNQRDRFRARLRETEEEIRKLNEKIGMLTTELEKTKADNVKLYGKIRYVQDYNSEKVISRGSKKYAEDLESGFSSDVESKYKKIYEDDINPFAAFSKKERDQRYKELGLRDKITLSSGRFLLSNNHVLLSGFIASIDLWYARTFAFFYTIGLHILVFTCLYRMSALSYLSHGPEETLIGDNINLPHPQ
ncbi:hypothetical protein DH2020_022811 [Rehmannia glutinosa]|uniref:CASP C-terminal domain-containing protein n=1 Tax=Rehmannia glutinosa TaxID=99300 RepID=A0ABR0W484_REHGL